MDASTRLLVVACLALLPWNALAQDRSAVALRLDGVPLSEAVKTVGALTGKNFVLAEALRARRITVLTAAPVPPAEAYRGFLLALALEGLAVVEEGGFHRIEHAARARPGGLDPGSADGPPEGGVRQVDERTWSLGRHAADGVLGRADRCLGLNARIVPSVKDGRPHGLKVFAVRPGSWFAALGILSGDVLRSVNGLPLATPEQALEAYHRLQGVAELSLDLERRGEPRRHLYRIE